MPPFGLIVSEVEDMKWFRWYHDTAADTKHALIARRTGQTKTTVIAFWAYILETASKGNPRGSLEALDIEEASVALEVDTEALELIHNEMQIKGLISNQEVTNWIKRQPNSDSTEAERARRYRENKKETESSRDGHGTDTETEEETELEIKTPCSPPGGDKSKRASRLKDDWEPSEHLLKWASQNHPAVDTKWQTTIFKNHFIANGKRMVSWDRAWQNWIARALDFGRPNPQLTQKLVSKSKNQTILEAWKDGKRLLHKPSSKEVGFEMIEPFNHLSQRVTEENPTAFRSRATGNIAYFVEFEVID